MRDRLLLWLICCYYKLHNFLPHTVKQSTVHLLCRWLEGKLSWFDHVWDRLGGFFTHGHQVFYTEEWLLSIRLHPSFFSFPFPGGVCSPGLKTWSLINGLFEKESGYESFFFLKEEGEACWWWLKSKDLEARVSWRHEKEWWNVRWRWVMERGRKWRQKEERCGWKGYTEVLWSPKVSPAAARGERLGCGLPLYPLTQWDSVWWTWGMLNDVRGGERRDTEDAEGVRREGR